ncbi:hypothetical protein TrVFT333_000076 [Trichoderma virens FT-333]|nr:hypothetical protein TrVFT333_000076 [Trichoderma virens FT-333]
MFAWTWFNNIGNREMYMNCAAVTIVNGKKRSSFASFTTLPDAFVANIGNDICTYPGKDVEFPHPGMEVERNSQGTSPPGQGDCSGSHPAPPPVVDPAGSQTPTSQVVTPQLSATPSRGDNSITSIGQPSAVPTSQQQQQKPSAPVLPYSSSSTAPQPLVSNCSSGSCPSKDSTTSLKAVGSTCVDEGQWNCAPGGEYVQRCASGMWSALIPMAAGTSCQLGSSNSFTIINQLKENRQN